MNTVEKQIQDAEKICHQRGTRLTKKRKQVLNGLLQSGKALSAYELIPYCKNQDGESLPAMSIYRILDFLQANHLVHKLHLRNKYIACAHIDCTHEHGASQFLICKMCQRVEEIRIDDGVLQQMQKTITNVGFDFADPQLEMHCICHACQAL